MIVGEAHIVVRAITGSVRNDIRRAFGDIDSIGEDAGKRVSNSFSKGLGNFGQSLSSQTQAARRQLDALIRTSYTLGPALALAAGAVGALGGAIGALGGIVAGAIPSLIVLPGIYAAIGQAALTLKLAFSGVSEAISAGMKAQQSSISSGTKAAKKDLSSYKNAIADAWRALQRLWITSNERADDAARAVQEAVLEVARTEEEAARRIADARRTVEEAQLDLNAAYEEAREQIQQLNFDAEDAALNEKRAALELDKARQTLLRTQDLPPNSTARREAELAYAQADLNYRRAIDANADMAEEQKRVAEEGADGTKVVQDAKKRLADAEQEYADTVIQAEQDISDAREKAAREYAEQQRINRDIIWEIEDAERRLEEAEAALAKARKDGGAAGVAAANNYNAALQKLSPEAQAFVKFMVNKFIPSIDDLKAAAGREFFPKLITAMTTIKDDLFPKLEPLLESTGGKLGEIAIKFADAVTSASSIDRIKSIWKSNEQVIESLGEVGVNALTGILNVLDAAGPLIRKFAGWLETISNQFRLMFNTKSERKDLTDFFDRAGKIAAVLGDITGKVFGALGSMISDLMKPGSGGWILLNFFQQAANKFQNFVDANPDRIREFFRETALNAVEILKAVGPFVKELLKLGENPAVGDFAKQMGELAPTVGEIAGKFADAGPSFGNFIGKLVELIDITTDTGAIQAFWDTLSDIADKLIQFFSNPQVQGAFITIAKIAATLSALRLAFDLLKMPVLAILSPIGQLMGAVGFLRGAFASLAAAFTSFKGPLGTVIFNLRMLFFAFGTGPVLLFAAAIAGVVAAFVAMWRESEDFRNALKSLVDNVIGKAVEVFNKLRDKVEKALEPLGGMEGVVDTLKIAFKGLGDFMARYVIPVFEGAFMSGLELAGSLIGGVIDWIGVLIRTIRRLVGALQSGDILGAFQAIWDGIIDGLAALGEMLLGSMIAIWDNIVNAVKTVLGISSPSTVFAEIATNIISGLMGVLSALPSKIIELWTTKVFPFIKDIPDKITGFLSKAWDGLKDALVTGYKAVQTYWSGTIVPFITGIPQKIFNFLLKAWDGLKAAMVTGWNLVTSYWSETLVPWVKDVGNKIKGFLKGAWNGLVDSLTSAWGDLKDKWVTVRDTIGGWITTLKGKISGIWDGFASGLSGTWDALKGWWNNLGIVKTGVKFDPPDWVPGVPDEFVLKFPALAKGGIVPATPGGGLYQIGEAGRAERVEPLDPDGLSKRDKAMIQMLVGESGGSGNTFNIYPSEGMDERELAAMIARQISFQMRKGASL